MNGNWFIVNFGIGGRMSYPSTLGWAVAFNGRGGFTIKENIMKGGSSYLRITHSDVVK